MSNSYAISLRDAIICLNGFASDMHSEYKKKGVNVQLGFDEERGGAVASSNPILPVKNVSINVGVKSIDISVYFRYNNKRGKKRTWLK